MNIIKRGFLVVVLALLIGCTSTGAKVEGDKLSQIQKNVTSEQEVVALLGRPTSVTTTADTRHLYYDYAMSDRMGRTFASSAASIAGGMVAGSLGSLAGSMAASTIPASRVQERLAIQIDPKTQKVINYQQQKTQSN